MSNPSPVTKLPIFIAAVAVACLAALAAWLLRSRHDKPRPQTGNPVVARQTPAPAPPHDEAPLTRLPPRIPPPTPAVAAAKARKFDTFQMRPFAATRTSGANEWTAEDGREPSVIRQLAHNEWEVERLTAENPTIKRRQLVYRKEPIAATIARARAAGETVSSFTLPALDGQEYSVEVTQNYVDPAGLAGSLVGHVKGRPNSMASIGFKNGYESFNIISPDDGIYVVADSREPGEVMVKEIDPGLYASPSRNDPDFVITK